MSDLSPAQVANRTGFSPDAIYRAIRRGELSAYKRCGRLRIRPEELDRWRDEATVRPRSTESPMPDPIPIASRRPAGGSFGSRLRALDGGARR